MVINVTRQDLFNQLLKKHKWTQKKFDKFFSTLKTKGFVQEYFDEDKDKHLRLNPALTNYPKNEKFSINVELKIV